MKSNKVLKNALKQSHIYIASVVEMGDTVVDATAGNGRDTVFLCSLVGDKGKVYAFDIQKEALLSTKERVIRHGYETCTKLIHDCHAKIKNYVKEEPKAIMFNLGYLPGGDHGITTEPETTIKAIEDSIDILKSGGLVSIVIYPGHETGYEEKKQIIEYVRGLDCRRYTVMLTEFVNQINCPPILVCIEKH